MSRTVGFGGLQPLQGRGCGLMSFEQASDRDAIKASRRKRMRVACHGALARGTSWHAKRSLVQARIVRMHRPKMRFLLLSFIFVAACGGQTVAPEGTDAGHDAAPDIALDVAPDGPIAQCNGYCPQPNGASCTSDCDCQNKCIGGICTNPTSPTVSCSNGDAGSTCPSGGKCGVFGTCEGTACKLNHRA